MRIDPLEILSYGEEPVDVNDLNVPDVEISPQSLCQLQLVNCRFRQLELDLPDFQAANAQHPVMFPSLPIGAESDQTYLNAWYFYLAEISLWRMETAARLRIQELLVTGIPSLEGLAESCGEAGTDATRVPEGRLRFISHDALSFNGVRHRSCSICSSHARPEYSP